MRKVSHVAAASHRLCPSCVAEVYAGGPLRLYAVPMSNDLPDSAPSAPRAGESQSVGVAPKPEHGGPAGLEPTRYGDWEKKGRCIDF